ncbi:hypothetical protein QBC46DRAFT_447383 [Diplogelasinospora grovesii]|uniref:Uncharacterized protein n=1 Tax=Diplogelasinospora grovesii TaxID=303347 RepID=A0AAN6NBN3_9PEZI|nr:hypothetical protein QBC46DRAFT_447383 [Diplogelasinospora grovesii]
MSFGFSPSDLVMLLKGLEKLAGILRKEAVESFRRCAKTYKRFNQLARHVDRFITDNDLQQNSTFRSTQRDIEKLLRSYFGKIEEFKPHLGPKRVKNSLRGAIAKIKWARHAGMLEQLRQDLESQLNILNTLILTIPRHGLPIHVIPDLATVPSMPLGDHFIFEDARRVIQPMTFRDIPNWDCLHEFLLRVFAERDRGHSLIKGKFYVLHNASTGKDILPSSPSVKLLRELINLNDRVEMSVIIPYEDSDTMRCPRCNTERQDISPVEVTCGTCALWVRFHDSFEDEPDPLTQLAMDDLRESGLRKFVSDFVEDIERNSLISSNRTDRELKDLIRPKFSDIGGRFSTSLPSARGAIQNFRRITLCTPYWPSIGQQHLAYDDADRHLCTVMNGVKRLLDYLQEGSDLPINIVGRFLDSRIGGRTEGVERFLKSIWSQHNSKKRPDNISERIIKVLEIHGQCAQECGYLFHPSVLRVRCLLWTFSHVLTLEAKILRGCSVALDLVSAPEGLRHQEHSPTEKAYTLLFIPHVFLWRMTFDVVGDAAALFRTSQPPPAVLGVIFRILRDSRELCLGYFLDGNLRNCDLDLAPSNVFNRGAFTSDTAMTRWLASYRQCAESVMSSEGDALTTRGAEQSLRAFWNMLLRSGLYPLF